MMISSILFNEKIFFVVIADGSLSDKPRLYICSFPTMFAIFGQTAL